MSDEFRDVYSIDTSQAVAGLDRAVGALAKVERASGKATYAFADYYEVVEKGAPRAVTSIQDVLQATVRAEQATGRLTKAQETNHTAIVNASAVTARYSQTVATSTKDASMAAYRFMMLGQTLDDLQYVGEQGLRPIINNLMFLNPKIGIAALAVNTLYNNWSTVAQLWGAGHTEKEAERMERLAKAVRNAGEEADLGRLQQAKAAGEGAAGPTKAISASTKAGQDAIREFGDANEQGDDRLARMLAEARSKQNQQLTGEQEAKLRDMERGRFNSATVLSREVRGAASGKTEAEVYQADRQAVLDEAKRDEFQRAKNDIGKALANPDQMKSLIGELSANPNTKGVADELRQTTPEALAAKERTAAELKAIQEEQDYQRRVADELSAKQEAEFKRQEAERTRIWEKHVAAAAAAQAERTENRILANNARDIHDPKRLSREGLRVRETARIQGDLEQAGYSKPEAAGMAPQVLARIGEGLGEKVRERALKDRTSGSDAEKSILTDRQKALAEKREQETQRLATEARKKLGPGIDREVDASLMTDLADGDRKGEGTSKKLGQALIRKGFGAGDAATAATRLVTEGKERGNLAMEAMGAGGMLGVAPGMSYTAQRRAFGKNVNASRRAGTKAYNAQRRLNRMSPAQRRAAALRARAQPSAIDRGGPGADQAAASPLSKIATAADKQTTLLERIAENTRAGATYA